MVYSCRDRGKTKMREKEKQISAEEKFEKCKCFGIETKAEKMGSIED